MHVSSRLLLLSLVASIVMSACATSDPVAELDDVADAGPDGIDDSPWQPDAPIDSFSSDSGHDPDTSGPDLAPDTSEPDTTAPDVVEDPDTGPAPGELCASCQDHADCGGPNDACLRNNQTGETLCGRGCTGPADCPAGYVCAGIPGIYPQCVPESQTCENQTPPPTCEPACGAGLVCINGSCVEGGQYEAELQQCVDLINQYRADHGASQLQRSSALESCAQAGAESDSQTGQPHGHFSSTNGCNGTAFAENEIPGWNIQQYGSVAVILAEGTRMMMDEGPGGGHYENILRSSHTSAGCGIHVTANGEVWIVQNFR